MKKLAVSIFERKAFCSSETYVSAVTAAILSSSCERTFVPLPDKERLYLSDPRSVGGSFVRKDTGAFNAV